MNLASTAESLVASRLILTGHVQGIGMRPAIIRLARRLRLTGFVRNTNDGVEIHIEGPASAVAGFARELPAAVPSASELASIGKARVDPVGFDQFLANQDCGQAAHQSPSTRIPVDLVVCRPCGDELADRSDRRHEYPFTSCTDCGPRYSIIDRMPYEREQTRMSRFVLCDRCQQEYDSPQDRRFQAQTNACPKCGPQLWVRDSSNHIGARGQDAVDYAAEVIRDGRIVALRGLGGYQLLVDATSEQAVQRLRRRKFRAGKPLAVMVDSLDMAKNLARLDDSERNLLGSPAGPIVVAQARQDGKVATSVTSGIDTIGLLFPTTPLHQLLLSKVQLPLVCTSGNVDGEPLVYRESEAIEALKSIADVWLEHDRPIRRPIDDSVVRVIAGRAVSLRMARGYAPLSLELKSGEPFVAVGGHQKTSIAISNGAQAILCPHIGDQDSVASRERFVQQVGDLTALYGLSDFQVVGDLHPDYFTTGWSESQPNSFIQVQHHHAHIVAGMLQHGWLDRQVLGIAMDGTGYGSDAAVWGGEFLLCTATEFQRVGHLRPFLLPGGEQAVRQPWRIATALVRDALGDEQALSLRFQSGKTQSLLPLLKRSSLMQKTTSAGRLFDGVAALAIGIESCRYDGEAAIMLEAVCDRSAIGEYDISIRPGLPKKLDWRPMIRQIMQDRVVGASPGAMAMRFHRGLASAIFRFCLDYSSMPIVMGGGVFQNRMLVELLANQFSRQLIGLPGMIPPGDGGLAAGQLAIATAMAGQRSKHPCA